MKSIIDFLKHGKKKKDTEEKTPKRLIRKKRISKRKGSFEKTISSTKVIPRLSRTHKKPSLTNYHLSTIRLFRALEVSNKTKKKPTKKLLKDTIKYGFVFSPEVVHNFSSINLDKLIKLIRDEEGISPEELNNAFHKSWKKIREASIEQLVLEQITHYFTTYGFEAYGVYNKDSVYIPAEKLEIPKINVKEIKLVKIKGYTKEELKNKLLNLLKSGVALKQSTIKDILNICYYINIEKSLIDKIKNREVRAALYDHFGLVPENPIEFLRFVIYKTTGNTLLIKDDNTINSIVENADEKMLLNLFVKYHKKYGLQKLGKIFLRFKPLFLALRVDNKMRTIINKIRKYAIEHHKPFKEDYLNTVTAKIKNRTTINKNELIEELNKVNTFRKIRLAYALRLRTKSTASILYKIRNGKGFATELKFTEKNKAKRVYDIVIDSIIQDISNNVKGKKIYIPKNITYALPATEKQFTDKFPNGTCITIPKDMIVGVHWKNIGGQRIDLDLSMVSVDQKIGWDARYRTQNVLFSGDMTDAQGKGATELFYVKKRRMGSYLLFLNYYNFGRSKVPVPHKIILAQERASNFGMNYMVDPNNIVTLSKSKINEKQKILGLLVTTVRDCKFYFGETYIGSSITSKRTEFAKNARNYLFNFFTKSITLNDILEKSGAKLVKNKNNCDIDLSPESLEKDTILNLIS
jgi:hypothetical protein|tara:strand:- start:104 stop:2179 length:2076 start_codon:yes stop_codon:yes gene_type:complete